MRTIKQFLAVLIALAVLGIVSPGCVVHDDRWHHDHDHDYDHRDWDHDHHDDHDDHDHDHDNH